jgi:hypothetical protein
MYKSVEKRLVPHAEYVLHRAGCSQADDMVEESARYLAFSTGMVIDFKALLPVASLCHIFTWHS